ncbi:MAG: hypothetical protein GVX78_04670, partial [Bacteroidetes bacterium]|nr:hypothetical protein [Bacteroidota bacterium]
PIGDSRSFVELDGLFSGLSGIGNTMLNIAFGDKTKKLFYSILFLVWSTFSLSAQENYTLSARIDTTNEEAMEVVDLWMNYLHSKPDSIYDNPYWNQQDRLAILETGMPTFDLGAMLMFRGGYSSEQFLREFAPTILSVDKIRDGEEQVYNIKTLFYSERLAKDSIYSRYKVQYITSYYCVKVNGEYKLKNAFPILVSEWPKFKVGYLHYIVHPSEKFNRKEAEAALDSCEHLVRRFNLERPDSISYVVVPNVNVMGQLYNFDYWLSYSTGFTHTPLNRIVLCEPKYNDIHELIHILFLKKEWAERGRPFIINEGLPTYFAGPAGENDFTEQLISFSKEVRQVEDLSLTDIIDRNYAHEYDNNPIYVTGGFIFKLVDEKHGTSGIIELFNCGRKQSEFQAVIEKLFDMPYEDFDSWIIDELKSFTIE